MYTLQDVKDNYYRELACRAVERMPLEQYIGLYYIPCYDDEVNLIGYEVLNEHIRTGQ